MCEILMKFFNALRALPPPPGGAPQGAGGGGGIDKTSFFYHFELCEDTLIALCARWRE
jgi:hypothetical protein